MRTVVRTKTINGTDYLYEITYYYDKVSKRTRQHSRYLGKAVDGHPVRVRDVAGIPKAALSYGEFLPCFAASETYDLEQRLARYLTPDEVRAVLTLVYNRVIRPVAMHLVAPWYQNTILAHKYPDTPLSSQYLSNLLVKIGQEAISFRFFQDLVTELSPQATLFYDITSLSSYTSTIAFFEYGHNRDGYHLPQVNMSLIVDRDRGIPLMYDLYPGSIVDVSTLHNTLEKLQALGVTGSTLIMDRGFCSGANLMTLAEKRISFIMPASRIFKTVKQALSRIRRTITRSQNLHLFKEKTVFVEPVELTIEGITFSGYGYYSPQREQDERERFYRKLRETIDYLESLELKPYLKPKHVFEKHAGIYARYLSWKVAENRFHITVREKAVTQRVHKMGLTILLYQGEFTWDECLSLYRSRDLVERSFDLLKNDLELLPLNVKRRESLCGLLFISFLSLLLRMHLQKQLQTTGLVKKYSLERVFLTLENIRWQILSGEKDLITEIGKKQRTILDAFAILPEMKNYVTT
ncbi:MAG TPA: IS1634 family transposase [Methanoculleus sp.]|nr:IS1634 family transposase [Methanoculleus sp.]